MFDEICRNAIKKPSWVELKKMTAIKLAIELISTNISFDSSKWNDFIKWKRVEKINRRKTSNKIPLCNVSFDVMKFAQFFNIFLSCENNQAFSIFVAFKFHIEFSRKWPVVRLIRDGIIFWAWFNLVSLVNLLKF